MKTFGKTTDGSTTITSSADNSAVSVSTPDDSGLLYSLTARTSVSAGSTKFRGMIYSDSNGLPSTLLAVSEETTISNTTEQENTVLFTGTNIIYIQKNTPYWIGVHWQDPGAGNFILSKDNNASGRQENTINYADGPSYFFGGPSALSGPIDVYVSYQEQPSMWNELSDAIVTMIKTSSNVANAAVLDYAKSKMDHYPTITVTPAENQEPFFADTTRRQRTYNFAIRVYQERMEQGEEESERIMRTLIDDLITIFDADIYLNNTLAGRGFARPIPSVWKFVQGEQVNTRMAEIILSCVVIQ